MNKKHDVIVVGAGPVGSYTAYQLAKAGLDVGIFERNDVVGKDVNCTGIVSTECMKKVQIPDEVVLSAVMSIRAVAPSGSCLRYCSPVPLAYVVDRNNFDREMNRTACSAGATTRLNARVERVSVTKHDFRIIFVDKGIEQECRSKIGVIATGFDLCALNGLYRKPENFLYGIQTDVGMRGITDVEVYFGEKIAPGSFAWVVPVNGKSAKIGLITGKNPAGFLKKFLLNVQIAERLTTSETVVRCSPIPLRSIRKSYGERFLIVGEAAGQVKATTGGGVYFGLLCAEIAAETIKKAVEHGDCSERMLREYETRWRKKIEPELKAGVMMRNIFSKLSDRQINFLMELAKRNGIMPIIEKADFDWHKDLITYLVRHLIEKNLFRKRSA